MHIYTHTHTNMLILYSIISHKYFVTYIMCITPAFFHKTFCCCHNSTAYEFSAQVSLCTALPGKLCRGMVKSLTSETWAQHPLTFMWVHSRVIRAELGSLFIVTFMSRSYGCHLGGLPGPRSWHI